MLQCSKILVLCIIIVSGKRDFTHKKSRTLKISRSASSLVKKESDSQSEEKCEGFVDGTWKNAIHAVQKMYHLGVTHYEKDNQKAAKSCLLHAVTSPTYYDSNDQTQHLARGVAWTNLGAYYQHHFDDNHKANICFEEAITHSGHCTSHIHLWDLLGPFPIGKSEMDGDPLATYGGITEIPRADESKYFSELIVGGEVGWTHVMMNPSTLQVEIKFPKVRWSGLVQALGRLVLEWQAWLIGDWHVNSPGVYTVHCKGVHTVYLDDQWLIGDQYHTDHTFSSINVLPGVHQIRIRFRKVHQGSFSCEFKPVETPLRIFSPHILPDIVAGALLSPLISVPLVNNHAPNHVVDNIIFRVSSPVNTVFSVSTHFSQFPLSPASGQTIYAPVKLVYQQKGRECPAAFNLEAIANVTDTSIMIQKTITSNTIRISFRCRKFIGQSFLFTFLDHDGAVNAAGAIAPAKACTSGQKKDSCPIVISLAGTGVSPGDMADSYKRMNKMKKWVFGVSNAWLLTPSRHGAHNWEGIGMRSVLSSLSSLITLTHVTDTDQNMIHELLSKRHADITRVIVAGHSMGGHGAWQLATHYPDIALCVLPAAAWIIKEDYGETNRIFEMDISSSHSDATLESIFAASVIENNADLFVRNLAGIPVLIRVGSNDQSVHPYFSRRMYRLLKEANYLSFNNTWPNPPRVKLSEIQGKEHWFWDTRKTNDGGVVNDAKMRKFLRNCIQKPHPTLPPKFSLTTHNPSSFYSRGGLRILQLTIPYRLGKIEVIRSENKWLITTQNIKRFSVIAVPQLLDNIPFNGFTIDKHSHFSWKQIIELLQPVNPPTEITRPSFLQKPHFLWKADKWEIQKVENHLHFRGPDSYGPIRQVFDSPYIIVYGTAFSEGLAYQQRLNLMYQWSAIYLANLHAMASEAYVPVLSDIQMLQLLASPSFQEHLYNYVLLGSPESNQFTAKIYNNEGIQGDVVPVQFHASANEQRSSFSIGPCNYNLPTHGVLFLTPIVHSTNDITLAVILEGLGASGLYSVLSLAVPTIPPMTRGPFTNMIPDYVVVGPEVARIGLPGVLAAGYWDNNWGWQNHLSYTAVCNRRNHSDSYN